MYRIRNDAQKSWRLALEKAEPSYPFPMEEYILSNATVPNPSLVALAELTLKHSALTKIGIFNPQYIRQRRPSLIARINAKPIDAAIVDTAFRLKELKQQMVDAKELVDRVVDKSRTLENLIAGTILEFQSRPAEFINPMEKVAAACPDENSHNPSDTSEEDQAERESLALAQQSGFGIRYDDSRESSSTEPFPPFDHTLGLDFISPLPQKYDSPRHPTISVAPTVRSPQAQSTTQYRQVPDVSTAQSFPTHFEPTIEPPNIPQLLQDLMSGLPKQQAVPLFPLVPEPSISRSSQARSTAPHHPEVPQPSISQPIRVESCPLQPQDFSHPRRLSIFTLAKKVPWFPPRPEASGEFSPTCPQLYFDQTSQAIEVRHVPLDQLTLPSISLDQLEQLLNKYKLLGNNWTIEQSIEVMNQMFAKTGRDALEQVDEHDKPVDKVIQPLQAYEHYKINIRGEEKAAEKNIEFKNQEDRSVDGAHGRYDENVGEHYWDDPTEEPGKKKKKKNKKKKGKSKEKGNAAIQDGVEHCEVFEGSELEDEQNFEAIEPSEDIPEHACASIGEVKLGISKAVGDFIQNELNESQPGEEIEDVIGEEDGEEWEDVAGEPSKKKKKKRIKKKKKKKQPAEAISTGISTPEPAPLHVNFTRIAAESLTNLAHAPGGVSCDITHGHTWNNPIEELSINFTTNLLEQFITQPETAAIHTFAKRIQSSISSGFQSLDREIRAASRLTRYKGIAQCFMLEPASSTEKILRFSFRHDYKSDFRYATVFYADAKKPGERICMTVSRDPKGEND